VFLVWDLYGFVWIKIIVLIIPVNYNDNLQQHSAASNKTLPHRYELTLKGSQNLAWGTAPGKLVHDERPSALHLITAQIQIPMVVLQTESTLCYSYPVYGHHSSISYGALVSSFASGIYNLQFANLG